MDNLKDFATVTDLETLACMFARAFVTDKRDDGAAFVKLRDGAPEQFTDICHEAHGDMMPDDTRYSMIQEVADRLCDWEPREWDDSSHEICDGLVDVYHSGRVAWLASAPNARLAYCDEAAAEYGPDSDRSLSDTIALGWYAEYREIYEGLARELSELLDEITEARGLVESEAADQEGAT